MSGGYGSMSGTSMATPHVAGLAALLFSLNPQLTNAQVRELIETNVDDLGAAVGIPTSAAAASMPARRWLPWCRRRNPARRRHRIRR